MRYVHVTVIGVPQWSGETKENYKQNRNCLCVRQLQVMFIGYGQNAHSPKQLNILDPQCYATLSSQVLSGKQCIPMHLDDIFVFTINCWRIHSNFYSQTKCNFSNEPVYIV